MPGNWSCLGGHPAQVGGLGECVCVCVFLSRCVFVCALRDRNACRTRNHCFPRLCHPWAMHDRHSEGQTSYWGILQVHWKHNSIVQVYASFLWQLHFFIIAADVNNLCPFIFINILIWTIPYFFFLPKCILDRLLSNFDVVWCWCCRRWRQSQMLHYQYIHLSLLIKTFKPDQAVLQSIGHVKFIVMETWAYLQYIDIVPKFVSLLRLFLSRKPVLCWNRRWKGLISLWAHVLSGKSFPGIACLSWI